MTVADLIAEAGKRLVSQYSPEEIRSISFLLAENFDGIGSAAFYACRDSVLQSAERIEDALSQLEAGRPLQYVLGYARFCGHRFRVREGCLIPRPETEELVTKIIEDFSCFVPKDGQFNILDMCTGSGCIAYSLASAFPEAMVYGCDISDDALAIAYGQRIRLQGAKPVFFNADITCPPPAGLPGFDLIVSNPPYIMKDEKSFMRKNVLDYEPEMALFVPQDNPLVFYSAIRLWADDLLKPDGAVYLEVNERLADKTSALFPGSRVGKDFNSKPRFVISRN